MRSRVYVFAQSTKHASTECVCKSHANLRRTAGTKFCDWYTNYYDIYVRDAWNRERAREPRIGQACSRVINLISAADYCVYTEFLKISFASLDLASIY